MHVYLLLMGCIVCRAGGLAEATHTNTLGHDVARFYGKIITQYRIIPNVFRQNHLHHHRFFEQARASRRF